ncbi:phytanoyl-CoA dioxygenase family protein [Catenulispora sp. NL8]|uniref:Phytanoyl-CoA dioxygenase family protein n=1 Tax=Catenulispora pinistramenti TaxID=2705254 RepID=A0ABS5L2A2_9ACTN|nr:phytanoyl-CoA dioxygenase family protein [Catenulispora pinistramenti]MBS2552421.1 phytanoyl-CoA dioxygenase family protein [Catenulispora pinistramenti]
MNQGPALSAEQLAQFQSDGYCLLPAVLPQGVLAVLREECQEAIIEVHARMDAEGVDVLGGSRRGLQYTPGFGRVDRRALRDFVFGPTMTEICTSLMGPLAYSIWTQFSVKMGSEASSQHATTFESDGNPQSLGRFSWHQDSGYVPKEHDPYLSCWVALDDVTEENGALTVIPFTEIGVRTRVTHLADGLNGDLVGYFGTHPGVPLTMPAGSIVCFSSNLFHSSPQNKAYDPRRALLVQYAATRHGSDGEVLFGDAEQLHGLLTGAK